ncbi:MAG TPA: LysE family transporter [Candidatus Sulfomarinibacteraceae bacterium]|nr:LysE family transporter [Candidatus Sulfomarinibacteraceae bacterium]
MIVYILQGFALGLPAAAQPGPFQAYLLSQTMKNGWRRTLPATLAPLLSDGPIIILTLFVLTQVPDWLMRGIQAAGGVFILYLARRAWLTVRDADFNQAMVEGGGAGQSVLEATLMNLLNPAPYIYWGFVSGPVLLQAWRTTPPAGVAFLLSFYGTLIGGLALVIFLFGTARRLGPRVSRGLTAVSALALLLFGLYQLWQAAFPGGAVAA